MRYYFCEICDAQDGDQSMLSFSNPSVVSKSRTNQIKHSCLLHNFTTQANSFSFKDVLLEKNDFAG